MSPSVSCRMESTREEDNSHSYSTSLSSTWPVYTDEPVRRSQHKFQQKFKGYPTFDTNARTRRSRDDARTLGDCFPDSFSILFTRCWRISIISSSSSSPMTSDSSHNLPATGPGMTGSSSSVPERDGCLGLSAFINAPTARFMACAKQLTKLFRKQRHKSWVSSYHSL